MSFSLCSNDGVFDVALHVHVQAYSSGRVTWTPPALYLSSCGVKVLVTAYESLSFHQVLPPSYVLCVRFSGQVTYFPFDWQNCTMQFRSYTYDSTEIELQYTLDSKGKEIKEIQLDEAFSGETAFVYVLPEKC